MRQNNTTCEKFQNSTLLLTCCVGQEGGTKGCKKTTQVLQKVTQLHTYIETLREEIKKSISKTYKTEDILLQTDFTLRGKETRVAVPNLSRSLYIPLFYTYYKSDQIPITNLI